MSSVNELRKANPSDPLVGVFDQIIDVYIRLFQQADIDSKVSNYQTFADCTADRLKLWNEKNDEQKILEFWTRNYSKLPLATLTNGDNSGFVDSLMVCFKALHTSGRQEEAQKLALETVALCEAILTQRSWDWYLTLALQRFTFEAAALIHKTGNRALAQKFLRIAWTTVNAQVGNIVDLNKYVNLPLRGQLPETPIEADLPLFQSYVEGQTSRINRTKMFNIPCDVNGEKIPVQCYIVAGKHGYQGLLDQFRWLKDYRGVTVPADVQDSLKKLHDIAVENNVEFLDLVTYALNYPTDKDKK